MFDEVFAPEYNQRHVAVTTDNKKWFLDLIHKYGPQASDIEIVGASGSPNPVTVGTPVKLSFDFKFNGPDGALNPTVRVTLPDTVTISSMTDICREGFDHVVICPFVGNFVGGVHIELVVIPTKVGKITVFAEAESLRGDPNPLNNSSTVDIIVNPLPPADVAVVGLNASPDPVKVGTALSYDPAFINNGPGIVTDLMYTVTLPAGVTFDSAGPGCSYSEVHRTVTCQIFGPVQAIGTRFSFRHIVVIPNVMGRITTTVRGTSSNHVDPNPLNNVGTAVTTVVKEDPNAVADLGFVRMTVSPDPARVGTPLTLTPLFTNLGPDAAHDITYIVELPASVSFVSASSGCQRLRRTVTCNFGKGSIRGGGTFFPGPKVVVIPNVVGRSLPPRR